MGEKSGSPNRNTKDEGVLAAYSRRTTVHGLQYILSPEVGIIRRVIWGTIFIIFMILFTYMLVTRVTYYLAYPTATQTETIRANEVPFPSVTICSQSPIKKTAVASIGVYSPTTTGYWEDAISNANLNISKVAVDAGTVLSNLVLSCQFGGAACTPSDWTLSLTSLGRCYTLAPPSGQKSHGELAGLQMVLNSESYDVTNELGGTPGIKVFLHSPNDLPVLPENGVSVQPGYDLGGQLSLRQSFGLPPPFSNCGVHEGREDRSCRMECLMLAVMNICGCVPYYDAGRGNTVCATPAQLLCSRSEINKFLTTGPNICECPMPCKEMEFSVQTIISPLSEASILKQLSADTKTNMTAAFNAAKALSPSQLPATLTYSDNIINVELFYKSLRYTKEVQQVAYNVENLFKDVAWILLIWFGASIMSLYEFIDLAFVAIARCCGHDRKTDIA